MWIVVSLAHLVHSLSFIDMAGSSVVVGIFECHWSRFTLRQLVIYGDCVTTCSRSHVPRSFINFSVNVTRVAVSYVESH